MNFKKADREAYKWQKFLGQEVGVPAFALALASASITNPMLSLGASFLSLAIMMKVIDLNSGDFLSELTGLRNKKDRTIPEEAVLEYANHKYLENKKYAIYLIGTFSLIAVMCASAMQLVFNIVAQI